MGRVGWMLSMGGKFVTPRTDAWRSVLTTFFYTTVRFSRCWSGDELDWIRARRLSVLYRILITDQAVGIKKWKLGRPTHGTHRFHSDRDWVNVSTPSQELPPSLSLSLSPLCLIISGAGAAGIKLQHSSHAPERSHKALMNNYTCSTRGECYLHQHKL